MNSQQKQGVIPVPNARAGSMKQQQVQGYNNQNAISEAYDGASQGPLKPNVNIQNQNYDKLSNKKGAASG